MEAASYWGDRKESVSQRIRRKKSPVSEDRGLVLKRAKRNLHRGNRVRHMAKPV